MSNPHHSRAMTDEEILLVNLSDDRTFDAGESGFSERIARLEKARIKYMGFGNNFEDQPFAQRKSLQFPLFVDEEANGIVGHHPHVWQHARITVNRIRKVS